jgi:hypothetical protein
MGNIMHLFRFAFVISLRNAAPSKGLSSSKAQSRSSETLGKVQQLDESVIANLGGLTSCTPHNYQILLAKVNDLERVLYYACLPPQ